MSNIIYKCKLDEIPSQYECWEKKWNGIDKGLIACWEAGRKIAETNSEILSSVQADELPILPWKGGFTKEINDKKPKYAPLFYLAMWQGIKGDDLHIDMDGEKSLTCSKTGMTSIFTFNHKLYENR